MVKSQTRLRRISASGTPSASNAARTKRPVPTPAPDGATEGDPEEDEDEPDFFERYWPYGAAIVLLGAFIAVIAATATTDGGDQPVLRFVPGGR